VSPFDLRPDLATRLDRLVPAEPAGGDWGDVLRRARPRPRLLRFKVVVAVAVFLLLAAIAAGAYYSVAGHSRGTGVVTFVGGARGPAHIDAVLANGKISSVWRCPGNVFCGRLSSVGWSRDGRRLAFTLDESGGQSAYVGLHILDLKTGHDLHLASPHLTHPMTPPWVLRPPQEHMARRLGCVSPTNVAWSPDGGRLAYDCLTREGHRIIVTIRRDGTGARPLRAGLFAAAWPTWSPDGRRIAFEGWTRAGGSTSVYIADLDGSHRALLVRHALMPDWSPAGGTIAFLATGGVRLVTPEGVDVTPRRNDASPDLAPRGAPAWSPDGQALAVGTNPGVYVVDRSGTRLRRLSSEGAAVNHGPSRPAWYPGAAPPDAGSRGRPAPLTGSCGDC
jgi:Tol biopolymer transport system component